MKAHVPPTWKVKIRTVRRPKVKRSPVSTNVIGRAPLLALHFALLIVPGVRGLARVAGIEVEEKGSPSSASASASPVDQLREGPRSRRTAAIALHLEPRIPGDETDLLTVDLSTSGENMLGNPGFESQIDHWYVSGKGRVFADAGVSHSGSASAKVIPDSSGRTSIQQVVQASPGFAYALTGWVRTADLDGSVYLMMVFRDGNGYHLRTFASSSLTATGDWKRLSITATAPSTTERIEVVLQAGAGSRGSAWFDDVLLESTGPAPGFVETYLSESMPLALRKLVIHGGGPNTATAVKKTIELGGGSGQARIVVVTTANNGKDYGFVELFREHGAASVVEFHTTDLDQANDPDYVSPIREATGVWFIGGDQTRIMEAYLGTLVERELWLLLKRGGVIGGSSAGAAIHSRVMIPDTYAGFGWLPGSVVDQHFSQRQRQGRLLDHLKRFPALVGIGIDEGMMVIARGDSLTVAGGGNKVKVYFGGESPWDGDLQLSSGDTVDLLELIRSAGGTLTLPIFADVPPDHPYHDEIEALYRAGYTAGCGENPLRYCPDQAMTRAEGAVFAERGIHGVDVAPTDPSEGVFTDVALGTWYAKWATALWGDGYTAGCGVDPLRYCPDRGHTRAEGAVFYLRMSHGVDFTPPDPGGIFVDLALGGWQAKWAEAAYTEGLIPACSQPGEPLRFCPDDPLTRGLAAYIMVRAKGLQASEP